MTPSELTDDVLAILRREFFKAGDVREYLQQRDLMRQAIAAPARYLNDRGARLTATKYRAILLTVIETIKRHGNRGKIERFSPYFLHCVQRHMQHHGDEYLKAAKDAEARPAGAFVGGVMSRLSAGEDRTIETLAEAHKILSSTRRIRKEKKLAAEPDLFDACKPHASGRK